LTPKLLIVEDDASTQEAWRVIFSRRGWEVAVASTVSEGLALLDPPPDYLILDLKLPDGDGEAILRKVRDDKLKTRVAVTTGAVDPTKLSELGDLEPEALFVKPADISDLWREGLLARLGQE